jgi:hypothetical protein
MIERTCQVLPDVVRDAFVSAQNVSFVLKESTSRSIVSQFWHDFHHVRTPAKLLRIVARMMARLSIVWEFKKHGHLYGATIARDLVSSFTWRDKVNLLFHKRTKLQQLHSTALGILWNRCLRNLSTSLFHAWSAASSSGADFESKMVCQAMFDRIFAEMNHSELEEIESDLQGLGIDRVLDQEIDAFKATNPNPNPSLAASSNLSRSSQTIEPHMGQQAQPTPGQGFSLTSSARELSVSGGHEERSLISSRSNVPFQAPAPVSSPEDEHKNKRHAHGLNKKKRKRDHAPDDRAPAH